MSNPEELKDFDIEEFKAELIQMTEEYADVSHITYGGGTDLAEVERKNEKAAEMYKKLVAFCAEALIESNDTEEVMTIIHKELLYYTHRAGFLLFGDGGNTFLEKLVIETANRVSNKSVTEDESLKPSAPIRGKIGEAFSNDAEL